MALPTATDHVLETNGPEERARLVRLCARLTGSFDAAEDLAQETLLEAWRNTHKLHDPSGRSRWLSAIARNVCLRWARESGRELARRGAARVEGGTGTLGLEEWVADPVDVEVELEHGELAELLDRALGLLPAETREVLTERYIRESPHAEIAERLGLSEGAVKLRLHRGRMALSRVLTTSLPEEAASYGLLPGAASAWEETRIWCVVCGARRLLGRFDRERGEVTLRCPTCNPHYLREPSTNMAQLRSPEILGAVKGYKPAFNRVMDYAYATYAPALERRAAPCPSCGSPTPLLMGVPEYVPQPRWTEYGVHLRCEACGDPSDICLAGLALWRPEGRLFWKEHPRMRMLPEREVEAEGRAAVVTRYESVTSSATFVVVSALDTFRTVGTYRTPGGS